jgi:hypothetical protein
MVEGDSERENEYWIRLNYGLAAVRIEQVREADGYCHHVTHMELPQSPDGGIPEVPEYRLEACNRSGLPLKGLLRGTHRMVTSTQESVSRMIDRTNKLVPDIDVDHRESK